jgi:hypothetical protein
MIPAVRAGEPAWADKVCSLVSRPGERREAAGRVRAEREAGTGGEAKAGEVGEAHGINKPARNGRNEATRTTTVRLEQFWGKLKGVRALPEWRNWQTHGTQNQITLV